MYRKIYDLTYVLSVVVQGFWSLLFPIGLGLFGGWVLVNKVGAPSWLMIVLTVAGVFVGLISMCKFLMSAMTALERRDKEKAEAERERQNKEGTSAEAEDKRKQVEGVGVKAEYKRRSIENADFPKGRNGSKETLGESRGREKNEVKNEENINGGGFAALTEKEVKDNEK